MRSQSQMRRLIKYLIPFLVLLFVLLFVLHLFLHLAPHLVMHRIVLPQNIVDLGARGLSLASDCFLRLITSHLILISYALKFYLYIFIFEVSDLALVPVVPIGTCSTCNAQHADISDCTCKF